MIESGKLFLASVSGFCLIEMARLQDFRAFFSAFAMLAAVLFCQGAAKADDAGSGLSEKNMPDSKLMKGRVTGFGLGSAGNMPRLQRPALPKSENLLARPDARPEQKTNSDDVLKARILEAAGLKPMDAKTGSKRTPYEAFALTASELRALSGFEISVLIDASGSMSRKDCVSINSFINQEKISRWNWCGEQSTLLSQQIASAFPEGITVTPFAGKAERYTHVSPGSIEHIFSDFSPAGATRLDAALDLELDNFYFERRMGKNKKPLLIAVITDGVPSSPHRVIAQIVELTRRINPGEVRIQFFLIGNAQSGNVFTHYISNLKKFASCPFNVVSRHSFDELCQIGLPRSLAQAVQETVD